MNLTIHTEHRSSTIFGADYFLNQRTLVITFHNGGQYEYKDVPPEEAINLARAASAGKYFHAEIKPRYHYRKCGPNIDPGEWLPPVEKGAGL